MSFLTATSVRHLFTSIKTTSIRHLCTSIRHVFCDSNISHSRAPKKNTSHGNEVPPQDTTHLIQRPCYQRGSPCQDPASNRTTRRPDHRKETHTAVVWSCLPFIRSGQNHLARLSERRKKTMQTEEELGRQRREWTGLELAKSQRAVENREKWRKLVAKSSVVPQRPSRLRD